VATALDRRGGRGATPATGDRAPLVTRTERLVIELHNRALLEQDLLDKRFKFRSRPYEAHVQYSNVCNMSCIMCYDGWHPPVKKMSPAILESVRAEVAPFLSVVIPYGGSEPLIVTWDQARDMARDFSIELRLTTNVQFLDEQKFEELKDITEALFLSIDSHIPELFEEIRPGSRPEKVFRNVPVAAGLAREHGVECLGQVVFMTKNAPTLAHTIAYLADAGVPSVNVLQLLDVNGRSGLLDPFLHLSAEYIESIKRSCIEVARQKRTRLIWNAGGYERHDFRTSKVPPKERKDWNHRWEQRMRHHVPGYCMNVFNRVQIDADGTVTPCAYATDDDLVLGTLAEQRLDEIWNSANAQDLRRGMLSWDYPSLCTGCMFTDKMGPEVWLPFVETMLADLGRPRTDMDCVLEVSSPAHMHRDDAPPTIEVRRPEEAIEAWVVGLGLGGEQRQVELCELSDESTDEAVVRLPIPMEAWSRLTTNLGYWWALFGVPAADPARTLRSHEIRCLVRHESLPRVDGSTLRYPDQGHLPVVDLGAEKQRGWRPQGAATPRPELGTRRNPWPAQRTHGIDASLNGGPAGMSKKEYGLLVRRLRAAVARALPAESTLLVVSKGDARLLKLDCRAAWHFPAVGGGAWAGYHPPDSESAIEQLKAMQRRGADYLVVPATTAWWLTHYEGLAAWLGNHCPVVFENERTGTIFALGPSPAFYGRARDAEVNRHLHPV
jgi:radical SAM protein with 4Fe4S-binding SPASM domain